jgi:hypothetical protein
VPPALRRAASARQRASAGRSGSGGRTRTYDQAPRPVRRATERDAPSVWATVSCTVRLRGDVADRPSRNRATGQRRDHASAASRRRGCSSSIRRRSSADVCGGSGRVSAGGRPCSRAKSPASWAARMRSGSGRRTLARYCDNHGRSRTPDDIPTARGRYSIIVSPLLDPVLSHQAAQVTRVPSSPSAARKAPAAPGPFACAGSWFN